MTWNKNIESDSCVSQTLTCNIVHDNATFPGLQKTNPSA